MKKLLTGGLIWAGLVCSGAAVALPSLQSCAVCSSPSAWTGPVGGPYQCSGGDGGKGVHAPGVTCKAFPNSGGYSVKGMNGSLNFTVDASSISPAACAQTFSTIAATPCNNYRYVNPNVWHYFRSPMAESSFTAGNYTCQKINVGLLQMTHFSSGQYTTLGTCQNTFAQQGCAQCLYGLGYK